MYESKYALRWDGDNIHDFTSLGFDCVLKYTSESKENGQVLHLFLSGQDVEVFTLRPGEVIRVSTTVEILGA